MSTRRHRWGEPSRFFNDSGEPTKTERACTHGCGVFKVTRHPPVGHAFVSYVRQVGEDFRESSSRPDCIAFADGVVREIAGESEAA